MPTQLTAIMTQAADIGRAQSAESAPYRRHSQQSDVRGYDAYHYKVDPSLKDEIKRFADEKKRLTMCEADEETWRSSIRKQMEDELNRRVLEALETPSTQKQHPPTALDPESDQTHDLESLEQLNSHITLGELSGREMNQRRWKVLQAKRRIHQIMSGGPMTYAAFEQDYPTKEYYLNEEFEAMREEEYERLVKSYSGSTSDNPPHHSNKPEEFYAKLDNKISNDFANLTQTEKLDFFYVFTKNGFKEVLRTGRLPDGTEVEMIGDGKFMDKYGIIRDIHGPFWPADYGPLFPAPPKHSQAASTVEPLVEIDSTTTTIDRPSIDTNPANNKYPGRWRGVTIIYDAEKSGREYSPRPPTEGLSPHLTFESRFECGNLRQARRIGAFEYELLLKTDLYTSRHTQWYYFRVQNAVPGVTYKFKIINLHKRDSLYNHGMRPLIYSEKLAQSKNLGWERVGHHIAYARNVSNLQCPLLARDRNYYTLEWQMEFRNADDTYYFAHCYPYTFTDLRDDLDRLLADPERSKVMKRQVMCETRAGNSCFLVTVTNFESTDHSTKKAIVVTARVHPGETNSSWMMRGLLEYITGHSATAKQLRNMFIFKIIPMLNPDGVIVGNYRCSLAGRDLNRNYRHPRKESFPTVWFTKAMMAEISQWNEILVYCDLHGHSRKHNVFMYGCNTDTASPDIKLSPDMYIQERLFPWLMSQKAPDKFWFRGCKFQVKRSKESTGRVVMYRQMKIPNSFTMEATFCGTTISSGERRHFNTSDYQDMGQVFCEVVMEYYHVQQNNAHKSEVFIELTKAITQQILESRGLLPPNVPDFTTEHGRDQLKVYTKDPSSNPDQVTSVFIAMVTKDKSDAASTSSSSDDDKSAPDLSKMDVHQLLDTMSCQTLDGCAQLLEQLHVAETMAESDSSDSDSESEPEMKYMDPKSRRRKKKHKKKSRVSEGGSSSAKVETATDSPNDKSKGEIGNASPYYRAIMGLPAIDSDCQKKKKQTSATSKALLKSYPGFVNKYTNRSNGGIPCYSEERQMARATKRMQDMKKKIEDDHKKDSGYYGDEVSCTTKSDSIDGNSFQRMKTHAELRRQFQQLLQPSAASNSIRTGYMHAAYNQDGQQHILEGTSMSSANGHPRHVDDSSSESSDDIEELPHRMPLAAIRNPYHNVLNPLPGHSLIHALHKGLGRLPSLQQHKFLVDSSCSIPRRHSLCSQMVVTPLSSKPDKSDSAPTLGMSNGDGLSSNHPFSRQKRHNGTKADLLESRPNQQGSLGLMSREYTDLLLHRLRGNKGGNSSYAPNLVQRTGERHSTCE